MMIEENESQKFWFRSVIKGKLEYNISLIYGYKYRNAISL